MVRNARYSTIAKPGLNTHNVSVSFHSGFREALIVLVFFLTLSLSGMRRAFTYGSERPFGSIGIKFFPWRTEYQRERERERVHKGGACFPVAINAVVEQHAFKVNKKFNPIRILCKTTWTTLRSGVGGKKKKTREE